FDNIPKDYFSESENISYVPFKRNHTRLCNFKEFKEFLEEYNTFVIEESEKQGLYKIVEDQKKLKGLNQRESRILPVFPLIKIDHLLVLQTNEGARIIGAQSLGMFYYFGEIELSKENLKKIYQKYIGEYNVFNKEFEFASIVKFLKYLYYDPDQINQIIYSDQTTLPNNNAKYAQAIYNKHLYKLFILEFMSYVDQDRDS